MVNTEEVALDSLRLRIMETEIADISDKRRISLILTPVLKKTVNVWVIKSE